MAKSTTGERMTGAKASMNTEKVTGTATFKEETHCTSMSIMGARSIYPRESAKNITGPVSFRPDGKNVFVPFRPLRSSGYHPRLFIATAVISMDTRWSMIAAPVSLWT
jgi:hypothetical protein